MPKKFLFIMLSFVWAAMCGRAVADGEYVSSPRWALQKLDWAKRTQPSTAWRIVVADGSAAAPLIDWKALAGGQAWSRMEWRLDRDWNGAGELSGTLARAGAGEALALPALSDGGWWLTVKLFDEAGGTAGVERFFLNVWDSPTVQPVGNRIDNPNTIRAAFAGGVLRITGGDPAWSREPSARLNFSVRVFDGPLLRRDSLALAKSDESMPAWEISLPEATPGRALRVSFDVRVGERIVDGEELWIAAPGDSSQTPAWTPPAGFSAPPLSEIFMGETVSSFAPFESQRAGLELQIDGLRKRGSGAVQLWVQWGQIEVVPGSYDWSKLDAYVGFLTEKGVPFTLASAGSVLFGNGPLETWGDWMLNHKGEFKLWRGLPVISPASKGWREGATAFTRRMIERYRGNPCLVGYGFIGQGMDSSIFSDHYDSITDYGPAARADFLDFMKGRYASPAAVGAAWGKTLKEWSDVRAPLPRLDQEVDLSRPWRDWTDWKLSVYRKSTVDLFDPIVAELDPRRAVIHYTVKTGPFEYLLKDVTLPSWATADGAGEDYRMDRINGITRNWGLLRQTESHEVPPANIRFMQDMVSQTLRGEAEHIRFNLVWNSQPALFRDRYPQNEALQSTLDWWTRSAELREELARARPQPAELGVVISWADLLHRKRVWRWYAMPGDRADKMVRASGFLPVRWLSEWTPEQAWSGLRAVLVPDDALVWDARLKERLQAFVRGGGQLVVWGRGGQYGVDEGEAGAPFAWTAAFGAGNLRAKAAGKAATGPKSTVTIEGRRYETSPAVTLEAGEAADVKILRDALGRPAVLEWAYGNGRVRWCMTDAAGSSEGLVSGLIEEAGVARQVVSSAPGIEGVLRGEGDRCFLVLSRFIGFSREKIDAVPLETSIGLPGLAGEWSVRRRLSQSGAGEAEAPSWDAFKTGTAKVSLLPSEMQVFELTKKSGDGRTAGPVADEKDDPFAGLRETTPPRVLREVSEPLPASVGAVPEGVLVRQVVFESGAATGRGTRGDGTVVNGVYAVIARPEGKGPHPALLLLHGGKGSAETKRALLWAKRGYVVLAPDIPGIADPEKVPHSSGVWTKFPYQHERWRVKPAVGDSMMFQSVSAAVRAFHLLRAQPDVDPARVGVHGISWGGYMTAMVCSIVGDAARAGFSIYGAGYYEECRYRDDLNKLPAAEREAWFRYFDAERRAQRITAPYFIAAAANDFAFYPPAVEKTLAKIPGATNRVYAPNANHKLPIPGGSKRDIWADMAEPYFAYHLRGTGEPFPVVSWESSTGKPNETTMRFRVTGRKPETVAVYYSGVSDAWPKREWKPAAVDAAGDGSYEVAFSEARDMDAWDCFVLVSDDRAVSVSSPLRRVTRAAVVR